MSPKAILVFCAQALLAQSAFSACAGGIRGAGVGLSGRGGCGGCGSGLGSIGLGGGYGAGQGGCGAAGVASTGGGLPVSSASPISPVGVSVVSENAYEGQLCAGGNLPFLGTVALEGVLPTAGAGAVSYGCGDGAVGISSEGPVGTGIISSNTYAPSASLVNQNVGQAGAGYGIGGAGYGLAGAGAGIGGRGCGCGRGISGLGVGSSRAGCGCGGRY